MGITIKKNIRIPTICSECGRVVKELKKWQGEWYIACGYCGKKIMKIGGEIE